MSSLGSSNMRGVREGTFKSWWANNVRDIAYGILYAMVKENNFNRIFVIVSIVIEFFQMIVFCFSSDFHWGGINFNIRISTIFVDYEGLTIVFWVVISLLVLSIANVAYIGYTFHQGEIKSINLLRTLRWICSLFVTILFIPILYVLLGPLTCDYSYFPATLMEYPSVECWGAQNTPISIIAIVLLVIFSVFSLIVGLTYYEYDPNMIKTYSRLQNRFEFGSLLIKIVIVFVSVFLHKYPTVYAFFSLVTSLMLVVCYIVMVPAYDRKINLTRAGSYAGIFWVNVCMIVALVIDDSHNFTSTIAAAVGCPWMIALGAFVADKRIKYLCNPRLVDGFVSSTDPSKNVDSSPSLRKPLKKGVKWEAKSQSLMKNALYARLKFPTDVEIAARFVLQDKPNAALIDKAKSVYQTGLLKFPKSPTVMMAYTNFIFTTAGDWQLGYVTLEKLRKMNPFMDISFFVYRYDKDREQRIEGGSNKIGDFVDFMEYKKLMRAAKQYHHMALVCIRRFWKHLMDKKIDVMQLSVLSSKIAFAEKKASENYVKLLSRYPKNIRVLRDYARFLDEVSSDEKLAHIFWKKADKYEEREMEKLTESHRSANNIEHTPLGDSEGESEGENHADNHSSSDKSSHTSDQSGDNTTVSSKSSGVRSGLEMAKQDKNNNLKKLGWIMFFTTLFAMVVMFTQLGVLNRQLGTYNAVILALDGAGGVSHTGIRVSSQAMDVYLFNLMYTTGQIDANYTLPFLAAGTTFPVLRNRVTSNLNLFLNDVKSLYWGESDSLSFTTTRRRQLRLLAGMTLKTDPSNHNMAYDEFDHKSYDRQGTVAFFNKQVWNETVVISQDDGVIVRGSWPIDFWTFSYLTYSYASEVGSWTIDQILQLSEDEIYDFSYLTDNVLNLAPASNALMQFFDANIDAQVATLKYICIAIFGTAVVVLVMACVIFFMPVVNSIFQYKIKTFHVFTLIPLSVVKHMARRKISSLGNDVSDVSGEEDDYNNNISKTRLARASSDTKFGTWKESTDHSEKSDVETDDEGPVVNKEMVELHTPSHITPRPASGGKATRTGDENESKNNNSLLGGSETLGAPASTNHITIQVSNSTPMDQDNYGQGDNQVASGLYGNENEEENAEEEEEEPKLSVVQKIKNKIWLKMPVARFTKLNQEEAGEKDKKNPQSEREKNEKAKQNDENFREKRNASRMNTASMRQVTRKLHVSYVFAIICFVAAMSVSFVTLLTEFQTLDHLSVDLKNSDLRTQYAHLILYDIQAITIYGHNDSVAITAAASVPDHIDKLMAVHKAIKPPAYQMTWLYGTGCYRINQTLCPSNTSYAYWDYINKGVEFTLEAYMSFASDLVGGYNRDGYLNYSDPQYIRFRSIAENDIMDGLERLTFLFQVYAGEQIAHAKLKVGIITGIVCVAFVFIHITLFKPFVRKLREESEHTFSIVRMIPRKLIGDIPEIQAFIQESSDTVDKEIY